MTNLDRTLTKVFVNVCAHDDIEKPKAEPTELPDGRRGETWSVPMNLKYDK